MKKLNVWRKHLYGNFTSKCHSRLTLSSIPGAARPKTAETLKPIWHVACSFAVKALLIRRIERDEKDLPFYDTVDRGAWHR